MRIRQKIAMLMCCVGMIMMIGSAGAIDQGTNSYTFLAIGLILGVFGVFWINAIEKKKNERKNEK